MKHDQINQTNVLEIATMRFRTVVAETGTHQAVTLKLPVEPGVNGFIVLLQPPLPRIN